MWLAQHILLFALWIGPGTCKENAFCLIVGAYNHDWKEDAFSPIGHNSLRRSFRVRVTTPFDVRWSWTEEEMCRKLHAFYNMCVPMCLDGLNGCFFRKRNMLLKKPQKRDPKSPLGKAPVSMFDTLILQRDGRVWVTGDRYIKSNGSSIDSIWWCLDAIGSLSNGSHDLSFRRIK